MLITLLIFTLLFFILVVSHEAGHFFSARYFGIRVEEFGFGLPPRIKGIKKGNTIYSINLLPFGGFVKILGEEGGHAENPESFGARPAWSRAIVLLAGVLANVLMAYVAFTLLSYRGIPQSVEEKGNIPQNQVHISIVEIANSSPAQDAGIITGDEIKKINGKSPVGIEEVQKIVAEGEGKELLFEFERNGKTFTQKIIPRTNPPPGEGPLGIALLLTRIKKSTWYRAPMDGARITWNIGAGTVEGFWGIIKNLIIAKKSAIQLTGPVGIFHITGEARSAGFNSLLMLFGILSVNLAIINVLPFPGLDGGRLLFLAIEKIRRKKISNRVSSWVHSVGLALLIILMLAITYRDIAKIFS